MTGRVREHVVVGRVVGPRVGAPRGVAAVGVALIRGRRVQRWNQGAGFVAWLPRLMNMGHALEICIMGDRRVSAQRAYEMGFVNKVVAKEDLMDESVDWARRICNLAPRSVRNFNQLINQCFTMTIPEAQAFASALEYNLRGMEDSLEGPKAFAEKRTPVFKGR